MWRFIVSKMNESTSTSAISTCNVWSEYCGNSKNEGWHRRKSISVVNLMRITKLRVLFLKTMYWCCLCFHLFWRWWVKPARIWPFFFWKRCSQFYAFEYITQHNTTQHNTTHRHRHHKLCRQSIQSYWHVPGKTWLKPNRTHSSSSGVKSVSLMRRCKPTSPRAS